MSELGIDLHLTAFLAQLDRAQVALVACRRCSEECPEGPLAVVQTQFWANVVSAEVLARYLGSARQPQDDLDASLALSLAPRAPLLQQAMEELPERLATGHFPPVLEAELTMAHFFTRKIRWDEAANEMRRLRTSGMRAARKLLDLDEAEISKFMELLEQSSVPARMAASRA